MIQTFLALAEKLFSITYMSDKPTGVDGVIEAVPALEVGVLPSVEDVLVALILGSLINDPSPALHPDGVTALEVSAELMTVTAAFIVMTLEVLFLIKEDLHTGFCVRASTHRNNTKAKLFE